MQLSELDKNDVSAAGTAMTLIANFGSLAGQLVREQVDKCGDRPDLAARWREIAEAVDTLGRANQHMEMALDLLDTIGETGIPPHLDAAIVRMGIRRTNVQPTEAPLGIEELDVRYLQQRTEQHLQLAEREIEAEAKGLHLNIAARYATLRELALRQTTVSATAKGTDTGSGLGSEQA